MSIIIAIFFFEAINNRSLEQLTEVFEHLVKEAAGVITAEFAHLGKWVQLGFAKKLISA